MKNLILVCGPAGIGKSTYCNNYIKEHSLSNAFVIAADEVRKITCGSYYAFPKNHNMMPIYRRMVKMAREYAKGNDDLTVFMDTTMLYDERRLFFVRNLQEFDNKELILLKLHDYSDLLRRNKSRIKEKWVPEHIVMDMATHYEDPSESTKAFFNKIETIYLD